MKPLTKDELKALQVGDWVWIEYDEYRIEGSYVRICGIDSECLYVSNTIPSTAYFFSDYGTKWLTYKNKEQAECKGEIVELPNESELQQIVAHACNHEGIAKHCPKRIAEAMYKYLKSDAEARLQELRGEK